MRLTARREGRDGSRRGSGQRRSKIKTGTLGVITYSAALAGSDRSTPMPEDHARRHR
jgi:hypothetical protein